MEKFRKKVDLMSRAAMTEYLASHFRYNTANGWNNSTSYAHNMKLHRLGLLSEVEDKLWELLECEGAYDEVNELIREFARVHNYEWQAGFNGRSGGYLVLYQGGVKELDYKSFCTACGQYNFTLIKETGCKCGRCGKDTRRNLAKPRMEAFVYSMRGIDMNEDIEDWSMDKLRDRVKLVQEFDQLADNIVAQAVYMAENYTVEEEEYFIPATRKVAVAV